MQGKLIDPVGRLLPKVDAKINVPFDIEIRKRTVRDASLQWLCEAQISVPGKRLPLRVTAVGPTLEAAVNSVKDGIEQRIKKFKGKKQARTLRGARKIKERLKGDE